LGERRNAYSILLGKSEGKRSDENICIDGREILKLILKN
jgi:hypothetical protein